jgi:hypothetical protein
VAPSHDIATADIEYQAVLGRGWLSPWVSGGEFCGSRGMALPVLGLRVRLRGAAAEAFDCTYAATFVDGAEIGPVAAGEACEAESLAPLESFQILLTPRGHAAMAPEPAYAPPALRETRPRMVVAKPAPAPARKAAAPAKAVKPVKAMPAAKPGKAAPAAKPSAKAKPVARAAKPAPSKRGR